VQNNIDSYRFDRRRSLANAYETKSRHITPSVSRQCQISPFLLQTHSKYTWN